MADQNIIAITGRLGQDAELRYTEGGMAILSLSVGNGVYKKGAGDYNTLTTWYRCSMIGARAESLYNMGALTKGARVGVTGQHSLRPYEKDGIEKFSNEINNCEITLLDGKRDASEASAPAQSTRPTTQQRTSHTMPVARNVPQPIDEDLDGLPF